MDGVGSVSRPVDFAARAKASTTDRFSNPGNTETRRVTSQQPARAVKKILNTNHVQNLLWINLYKGYVV